jgi:anti-sigma factor RsiW
MVMKSFNNKELLAYLDEALPAETMATIEDALRQDTKLTARLTELIARRDSGTHSLGEIWRRCRLSCAPREQLGSHLLGILPDEESGYISFHIETIGCRYCQANLADLKAQQSAAADRAHSEKTGQRRKKYFQSSAGHLQAAKR